MFLALTPAPFWEILFLFECMCVHSVLMAHLCAHIYSASKSPHQTIWVATISQNYMGSGWITIVQYNYYPRIIGSTGIAWGKHSDSHRGDLPGWFRCLQTALLIQASSRSYTCTIVKNLKCRSFAVMRLRSVATGMQLILTMGCQFGLQIPYDCVCHL